MPTGVACLSPSPSSLRSDSLSLFSLSSVLHLLVALPMCRDAPSQRASLLLLLLPLMMRALARIAGTPPRFRRPVPPSVTFSRTRTGRSTKIVEVSRGEAEERGTHTQLVSTLPLSPVRSLSCSSSYSSTSSTLRRTSTVGSLFRTFSRRRTKMRYGGERRKGWWVAGEEEDGKCKDGRVGRLEEGFAKMSRPPAAAAFRNEERREREVAATVASGRRDGCTARERGGDREKNDGGCEGVRGHKSGGRSVTASARNTDAACGNVRLPRVPELAP